MRKNKYQFVLKSHYKFSNHENIMTIARYNINIGGRREL